MRWLEKIENRLGWLAFPGLPKYLVFLGVLAYACQWMRPDLGFLLDLDRGKILAGEVWRIFTFPFSPWGLQRFSPVGVIFLFFAVQLAVLMSDALEEIWGPVRTTLYVVCAWAGMAVAQLASGIVIPFSGSLLGTSLFLAFATLFPRFEIRVLFFIPIQMRFLGIIAGASLAYFAAKAPVALVAILPALLPYFLWVLPSFARDRAALLASAGRRRESRATQTPASQAFHRCESCGRTEQDDPQLDFYTLPDGKEYCADHLPPGS